MRSNNTNMKDEVFTYTFTSGKTSIYYNTSITAVNNIVDKNKAVWLVDENVYKHHLKKFKNRAVITVASGEKYKNQKTVNSIIKSLLQLGANKQTVLIGVGGGVVTDITGYVASIYMRGIDFGFIPTTILALVDASIGGKNGVDVGVYKNMIGTIRQPSFILQDYAFLKTLPLLEWQNGFAEIIKHACIQDADMFNNLCSHTIAYYKRNSTALAHLIATNTAIKLKIVQQDEFENNKRKWLNFGHTLGHAIENYKKISHGYAISIGMMYAAKISEELLHFKKAQAIKQLLMQYQLPYNISFNLNTVMPILQKDKKKQDDVVQYILLKDIGKPVIHPLGYNHLQSLLQQISL